MKDKFGKYYRSYKLISINWKDVDENDIYYAVNKSNTNKSIGPIRAANKIFNSWCKNNKHISSTIFGIQEITRGCINKKIFLYTGSRIEKKHPCTVLYENAQFSSKKKCIIYKYDLIISPYIKDT